MELPKISIITPSYNQGEFIEQTIRSIVDQRYPNLEYIVMDGGSTDNTVEILKKYEKHFTYWVSEKDRGQTHAINKGLEMCTGDIFYWINADDYLEPGCLMAVAKEFVKKKADVLCVTNRSFEHETGNTIEFFPATFFPTLEQTITDSSMSITLFFDLNKAKQVLPITEGLHYAMDFELYYRFALKFGVKNFFYSDIPVVTHFRVHNNSKTEMMKGTEYVDVNAMHHSILTQLKAPDFILDFYNNINKTPDYQGEWDFSIVNSEKLFAYYANKLSLIYYINGAYQRCYKCVRYALTHGYPINSHIIMRLLKVGLLSEAMINRIRGMKSEE